MACKSCRKLKIKCGGGRPCPQCTSRKKKCIPHRPKNEKVARKRKKKHVLLYSEDAIDVYVGKYWKPSMATFSRKKKI
jgi:hypothetical protein